jgi:hypothetical protein
VHPAAAAAAADIMRSRADSQMTLEDSELVAIDSLFGGVAVRTQLYAAHTTRTHGTYAADEDSSILRLDQ